MSDYESMMIERVSTVFTKYTFRKFVFGRKYAQLVPSLCKTPSADQPWMLSDRNVKCLMRKTCLMKKKTTQGH